MSYEFYCYIEGSKQGKFKGHGTGDKINVKAAHKDAAACLRYFYEVKSPRDASTGQASGKRQHGSITVTKEWDAATPQIFAACVTNEVLKSVVFKFFRTNPNGEEYEHHEIKLVNATISNIKHYIEPTRHGESIDTHELEDVSFTFQRIDIENKDGKTMATDDWTK